MPDPQMIEEMFVQVASGAECDGDHLALVGVAPSTLYFSDRPKRIVGHMTNEQFIEQWDDGDDSFASDPPNAVLSFFAPDSDVPGEAVVVLSEPETYGDGIRYSIDVLEGDVPAKAGASTLFIDPLGRPLSPVSVAGMRRRDIRRERRRI
jgi:hypothetical protein